MSGALKFFKYFPFGYLFSELSSVVVRGPCEDGDGDEDRIDDSDEYASYFNSFSNGSDGSEGFEDLEDSDSSGYASSERVKHEGSVVLSRKAWTKFMDACMSVIDDCRQIHAQTPSPFQSHKKDLLNIMHGTQAVQKKFRIDVWNNAPSGGAYEIPISYVTTGLQRQARQRIWEEANPGKGLPTQTCRQLQDSQLVQVVNQLNAQAPDSHFVSSGPQGLYHYEAANGNPIQQPSDPEAVADLGLIRDVMHCWSDPECPRRPPQAPGARGRGRGARGARGGARARAGRAGTAANRWTGCGPSVKHLVPDILIMATENSSNVRAPPNAPRLPPKGDIRWKFPYLCVEIVGGKDEWHSQDTFLKIIQECSLTLHFSPRAYYMLIYVSKIRFGVITRNIDEGVLEIQEEFMDLNPRVFPTMRSGGPAPIGSQGLPNDLINNVAAPPASDLSVKLQQVACRVINAVLDIADLQTISQMCCNDLRLLPNWGRPLPCSPAAENNAQAGSHRGFKCFIRDRVQFMENPASTYGQGVNSNQRQPRAPQGQDQAHMADFVSVPVIGVDHCYQKCRFGTMEVCRHINDMENLRSRRERKIASRTIRNRFLPLQ